MKSKNVILLFFALPFVMYGGKVPRLYGEEVEKIDILAKNGTVINKVLLLKEDGFLGEGGSGFVYEGTIVADNRPVAIKFVDNIDHHIIQREMEMYCYLKAYKNASVEKYGISAVYYYGRWENYILIALTKLDMDLFDVANDIRSFGSNPLDILILLRDFVFISKYMHSQGIRHDDLKPDNLMIRGHRCFLIDLNSSSKMTEDNCGGTLDYICNRDPTMETRRAIDDWESFLYTLSVLMRRNWFGPGYDNECRKDQLGNNGLEGIIKTFAVEVFTNNATKEFPDYNKLDELISREIKRIHPIGSPKFSWVTSASASASPVRKITDIAEPKSIDFTKFKYPPIVHLPPLGSTKQATLSTHTPTPTRKSSKRKFGCSSIKQCE